MRKFHSPFFKRTVSFVFGLLLLSQLSGNAFAAPIRLVLNWKPEAEFGGFYTAQLEGFFKKRGLDVQIIPGGASTPTIQMVAAGQTELAIVAGEELVLSRSKGSDVVALYAVNQISPNAILTHEERGFKSLKEVFESPGILAVDRGLPFYSYLVKKFGKPKARVVPYLGGLTNFFADPNYSQQSFIMSEPLLAAQKGVKTKSFLISDEGFGPYMTVVVARKGFIDQNPDLLKGLVAAFREGWRNYLDDPEKTNVSMNHLNPSMDLKSLRASAAAQKPFVETTETKKSGLGFMTEARWKALIDQLKSIHLIKTSPEAKDLFQNL